MYSRKRKLIVEDIRFTWDWKRQRGWSPPIIDTLFFSKRTDGFKYLCTLGRTSTTVDIFLDLPVYGYGRQMFGIFGEVRFCFLKASEIDDFQSSRSIHLRNTVCVRMLLIWLLGILDKWECTGQKDVAENTWSKSFMSPAGIRRRMHACFEDAC